MSGNPWQRPAPTKPEETLAWHINRWLIGRMQPDQEKVTADEVRSYIIDHWSVIQFLGHAIHDGYEEAAAALRRQQNETLVQAMNRSNADFFRAYMNDQEYADLKVARERDKEMMKKISDQDGIAKLTELQNVHAAELQRALKNLPLDVIYNHLHIAMLERPDYDEEQARKFANMFADLHWQFL